MSASNRRNRREHEQALMAAARVHGVEIVPSGNAWRIRAPHVDMLVTDLKLVQPRDLAPHVGPNSPD